MCAEAAVQHPEEINPNVAEGEVLLSIADGAMDVVHDLVPAIVSSSAWPRCIVDLGDDSPSMKVYFDFFTHSSGRQRGFVDCGVHGCRRYVFCTGTKLQFCAEMYLWVEGSLLAQCRDKLTHLSYRPLASDVLAVMPQIRLVDF